MIDLIPQKYLMKTNKVFLTKGVEVLFFREVNSFIFLTEIRNKKLYMCIYNFFHKVHTCILF